MNQSSKHVLLVFTEKILFQFLKAIQSKTQFSFPKFQMKKNSHLIGKMLVIFFPCLKTLDPLQTTLSLVLRLFLSCLFDSIYTGMYARA
jgi:hypothetical protein